MEKRTMLKYEWQQENLTVERQRVILEKRREYLLQLMPDDISVNAGSTDSKLIEEWQALQQHRDKLLHSQIDKENERSLDSCYLNLLHMLTSVGSYDHSATCPPMKHALYALYWELKKYFSDVDIANTSLKMNTSLTLGTPTRPSPHRRKNKRLKLNKPDLIPSVNVNQDSTSTQGDIQAYQSPKRYKPSAQTSSVGLPLDKTPLLAHMQLSSEWESTDETFCSMDVTDLSSSTCSAGADASVTPVHETITERAKFTPRGTPKTHKGTSTPLANTPVNVSFNNGKDGLVTPKSARAPNFTRTPVSTRTPLIRGVISYTPAPSMSKSRQRATPYKLTPGAKSASPYKRRSPLKASPRRSISAQLRKTATTGALSEVNTARSDDTVLDMDTTTEHGAMGDVVSKKELHAELEKEQNTVKVVDSSPDQEVNRPLPAPHIMNAHDRAMAQALQKTFQNYKRGGVYTSPIKIEDTTEKEESFNISID